MKIKNKRVTNLKYTVSDFPPKPRKRDIKFALVREGSDLFFVNQSSGTVAQVSTDSLGFLTVEDTVYTPEEDQSYTYQDVLPGEGVLVENYDDSRVFNGDFMLGLYIYINNEYRIMPMSNKKGVQSQPLLYADGTTPRYVSITKGGN